MELKTRREAVKGFLSVGLFALTYRPFKGLFFSPKPDERLVLPEWKMLVDYARWCPTVHNLQPHKVRVISSSTAEIYYDPQRLLPVGDPNSVFATVALGVFVENLSIAAAASGTKVEIIKVHEPITTAATEYTKFLTVQLSPLTTKEELSKELILKRRTSRLHYDGKPLKEETLAKVKTECTNFGQEFFSTVDQEKVDFMVELNQETLFEDISSKENRTELDRLFRYSKEEAETKKDGLWATCMCFPGKLMKSVFTEHEKWEKGWHKKILAKRYKASFKGTATVCWIGGQFKDNKDWLNCGQLLARLWLQMTKDGAYIQPCGSLITNESAYKKINEKFDQPTTPDSQIWMLFRAGYSKEPAKSYRLETEQIMIN